MKTRFLKGLILAVAIVAPAVSWCQSAAHDALKKGLVAGKWDDIGAAAVALMKDRDWQNQASALQGYAALAKGDSAAAVTHLRKANFAKPSAASTSWLQALADKKADSAAVQFAIGDALQRSGETKGALARFDQALKLQPDFPVARLARATLRAMTGASEQAMTDLEHLKSTPVAADAFALSGLIRIEKSDYASAAEDLNRAVELSPKHAVAWNSLGVLHTRQNKWPDAAQAFEKAFKLAPDLVEARVNYQVAQQAGERGAGVLEQKRLSIYITDFGINNWSPKQKMFGDFRDASESILPKLSSKAQILIPMYSDKEMPKTEPEWQTAKLKIANGIIKRIEQANLGTHEVRITQNINTLGYFDKDRQNAVGKFGSTVYEAMALVKTHFERKDTTVYMPAVVGSNGAKVLTEVLPRMKHNPVDGAVLIDGRAKTEAAEATYNALGGRLTIINTYGDAPAARGILLPGMIANHAVAKALKDKYPDVAVFLVDPAPGTAKIPIKEHLFTTHRDNYGSVREYNHKSYTSPAKMSGTDLLGKALDLQRPSLYQSKIPSGTESVGTSRGGISVGAVDVVTGEGGRVEFKAGGSGTLKLVNTLYGNAARLDASNRVATSSTGKSSATRIVRQ